MRRYRNRRFARRNYRLYRRRRNNYFKQHGEQARYAKLITRNDTVKRIVNLDDEIYIFNNSYSFSEGSSIYGILAHYEESKDFQKYATIYGQYRILGVKVTIYKSCVPEVLVSESTDKEFGLLGFNISAEQPIVSNDDVECSDTTFWLTFTGAWSTQSKFYSFVSGNSTNNITEWQPTTTVDKGIYLGIATKGSVQLPSGWKMFYVSLQFMCEFSNPI